jgi:hypothetical protein
VGQPGQVHLYHQVQVLGNLHCHLATAHCLDAKEAWAVLTNIPPSVQTFSLYSQRFGGIEPHFKDYKSAAFDILRSRIRNAQARRVLINAAGDGSTFCHQSRLSFGLLVSTLSD